MYPAIHHQIAQARLADLHSRDQRDALARAARRARRGQGHQSAHPAPALPVVRRIVLAALIRLLPQRLRMHQVVTPGTAVPPPCGHPQMDLSALDRPWPGGRAATAIRPAHRADLAALRDFFAGLSAHTRYLRFFGPVTPSSALLQELCGLADTIDAVIAVRGGVIVGHAMAADRADPRGTRVTDIGVVVADAWQGRGLGSALMRALVTRAQARGVTLLEMDVLDGNRQVLDMITSHWPAARIGHSPDSVSIRIRLPVGAHVIPRFERLALT